MTSLGTDVFFYVMLLVTLTGLVRHFGGEGPILLKLFSRAGTSRLTAGSAETRQVERDASNLDRLLMLGKKESTAQRFVSVTGPSGCL